MDPRPAAAHDAVSIRLSTPGAATSWGDSLRATLAADPRVLDAVSPPDHKEFDPEGFLRSNGTLYLLATGAGSNNSAALVSACIEDLVETARRIAARSASARPDPPVMLALDEIGNLAPLPSLPTLMADGGGTGTTTMPVLQSLAQACTKWSDNAAGTILDSSIVRIVLGGGFNSRDPHDLSTLIGDRGSRSSQRALRQDPIMPPDTIRTLPFRTALIMLRAAPPIIARLQM